jgi:hypothetical protein
MRYTQNELGREVMADTNRYETVRIPKASSPIAAAAETVGGRGDGSLASWHSELLEKLGSTMQKIDSSLNGGSGSSGL